MRSIGMKRFFAVFVAAVFLLGSVGYVDAAGSSSFGGGSRGSVSSGPSSSRPSTSGYGSSSFNSPSKPSSLPSSPSGGYGSKTYSPPTPSSAPKPSYSTSSGATSPSSSVKTGSFFGGGVDKGISQQQSTPNTYSPPSSTGSTGGGSSVGGRTTVTNNRTTIIYRDRPSGWAPMYYGGYYSPTHEFVDLWWKLELLKTMQDNNERNRLMMEMRSDPNYGKFRAEADRVAAENKELKEQLAKADAEAQKAPVEDKLELRPPKKSHAWAWAVLLGLLALIGGGILLWRKHW